MLTVLFDVPYDEDNKELQIMSSLVPSDRMVARMKWVRYIYPTKSYFQLKDAIAQRDTKRASTTKRASANLQTRSRKRFYCLYYTKPRPKKCIYS